MHSKAMFVAVHSRVTFTSVTVTKSRKSHGSVRFDSKSMLISGDINTPSLGVSTFVCLTHASTPNLHPAFHLLFCTRPLG